MAWVVDSIRFGADGGASVSWDEACDVSSVDWDTAVKLIVSASLHSSDHTPGSKSLKLRWRNKTDNPTGSFADLVTGSGELRAAASAGALSNTTTPVTTAAGCDTTALDEEVENESPLQSGTFSPEKNAIIETQWCIDVSNADSDEYEFEIFNVTDDESNGAFAYTVTVAAAAPDACTADDITSGTPVLGTPTAARIPNLAADDITSGTPVLGTPTLGQKHDLTANDITAGAPVLGTPTVGVKHNLVADDITSGTPVLGTPVLAEDAGDACTADDIVSGTPVLGTPTVGQAHGLTADNIVSQSPALGTPTLGVIHNLLAENIVTGSPVVDAAILGQEHDLTADNILSGTPALGTPTAAVIRDLTANDITAGAPVLGTPTVGIAHNLVADNITAGGAVSEDKILMSLEGETFLKAGKTLIPV
jgi:hypothetical protein